MKKLLYSSRDPKVHLCFQIVFLNTLTSEYITLDNPLPEDEKVCGVYLLNTHMFVYGHMTWCRFDLRGNHEESGTSQENDDKWKILKMEWSSLEEYKILFWTGDLDNPEMALRTVNGNEALDSFYFYRFAFLNLLNLIQNFTILLIELFSQRFGS